MVLMEKNPICFFLIANLLIISNASAAQSNEYEDMFTRLIYKPIDPVERALWVTPPSDMDPVKRAIRNLSYVETYNNVGRELLSDQVKRNLGTFYYRKLICLEQKKVYSVREKLNTVRSFHSRLTDAGKNRENVVEQALSSWWKIACNFVFGPGSSLAENRISGDPAARVIGSLINVNLNDINSIQNGISDLEKYIGEYEQIISDLQKGVLNEGPIKQLEEDYVVKINNPAGQQLQLDLRDTIEHWLLNSRKPSYPFQHIKQALERAIKLPIDSLEFDDDNIGRFLMQFDESEFFRIYGDTKNALKSIIATLVQYSKQEGIRQDVPLRGIYYFWGAPGIGKSAAAEAIAKLMELPSLDHTIRCAADLSLENLEGTDPLGGGRITQGLLAQPLLKKASNGKTYSNSILILEDFDRIFLDDSETGRTALAFLLEAVSMLFKIN